MKFVGKVGRGKFESSFRSINHHKNLLIDAHSVVCSPLCQSNQPKFHSRSPCLLSRVHHSCSTAVNDVALFVRLVFLASIPNVDGTKESIFEHAECDAKSHLSTTKTKIWSVKLKYLINFFPVNLFSKLGPVVRWCFLFSRVPFCLFFLMFFIDINIDIFRCDTCAHDVNISSTSLQLGASWKSVDWKWI